MPTVPPATEMSWAFSNALVTVPVGAEGVPTNPSAVASLVMLAEPEPNRPVVVDQLLAGGWTENVSVTLPLMTMILACDSAARKPASRKPAQ